MKNPHILTLACLVLFVIGLGAFTLSAQDQTDATPAAEEKSETAESKELTPKDEAATEFVSAALEKLFEHNSIQADLTQKVALGDFHFQGSGKYYSGTDYKSRIEYNVKLGEMEGSFLEVCDGQILHTKRQINKTQKPGQVVSAPQIELSRRDILKILNAVQVYKDLPDVQRAAMIGIGGLPSILASLERTMVFDGMQEDQLDDLPVIIVQARWNPEKHGELMGGLGPIASQVQQFMPDRVRITFQKDSLFPRKFQYLKRLSADEEIYRPLLTVSLDNVVLNESIPLQRFSYIATPGFVEQDGTAAFIENINQTIQTSTQPQGAAPTRQ